MARVTIYRADNSIRDVAVGSDDGMDRFRLHYESRLEPGWRIVVDSDAVLANEQTEWNREMAANRAAGIPDWGRPLAHPSLLRAAREIEDDFANEPDL